MLWKCCTQYASKFGKLSSGHKTGKGQFSFQSRRKAMPKNAQSESESEVAQLCLTLCDPIDGSPPAPPCLRFSKNTGVGCHFLFQRMKVTSESEVAQSCPTLSDPMDCSLPGSSIHGIFQARIPEWAAISFSRGSSQPRDRTRVSCIADRRFTVWELLHKCTHLTH